MRRKALKNAVERVIRGGSYFNVTRDLRTTDRFRFEPADRYWSGGFRLVARQK